MKNLLVLMGWVFLTFGPLVNKCCVHSSLWTTTLRDLETRKMFTYSAVFMHMFCFCVWWRVFISLTLQIVFSLSGWITELLNNTSEVFNSFVNISVLGSVIAYCMCFPYTQLFRRNQMPVFCRTTLWTSLLFCVCFVIHLPFQLGVLCHDIGQ